MTATLCLFPPVVLAQAGSAEPNERSIEGRWNVRWAQGIRTDAGGLAQVRRWGHAELVLSAEGDSVTGRWATDGPARATWEMSGTFHDGHLRLTSEGHDSDDPELAVLGGIALSGTLVHDRFEGTLLLTIRGRAGEPVPRPWSAVRAEPPRPH